MENIKDIYPLSPMQEGMLFHSIYSPESAVYKEQFSCKLVGKLDKDAFISAWQKIFERHEILRSAFIWEGVDEPLQVVHERVEIPFIFKDISQEKDKKKIIDKILRRNRENQIEFSSAPLVKISLLRIETDLHHLVWDHHHILFDGWTLPILMQEFMQIYESITNNDIPNLAPTYPYKNYIAWLKSQDEEKSTAFWEKRLSGLTKPTKLSLPPSGKPAKGYSNKRILLNEDLSAKIRAINVSEKITINTLIQTSWSLLLSYYTGEEDVVFGATLSGRNADVVGIESMVGLFINTLPVRTTINKSKVIIRWLKEFQLEQSELQEYEYSPLSKVQALSDIPKGEPLFNTIVVFENYPINEALGNFDYKLQITNINTVEKTNYPITLVISPGNKIGIEIAYDTELFDDIAIEQIMIRLQIILKELISKKEEQIGDIEYLSDNELETLKTISSNSNNTNPPFSNIVEWFDSVVENRTSQIAIVDEYSSISFNQLNDRANQIANFLIERSIKSEKIIGVCLERSIETITILLGINKTGAAFLPIDINYPIDRIKYIIEDSKLDLLITESRISNELNLPDEYCIDIDEFEKDYSIFSQSNPKINIEEFNTSYIIYTSGSTGKPKGVCITQLGLSTFINSAMIDFNYGSNEKILQFSSFGFDAAVFEIYSSLLSSATLFIPRREITLSEKELSEYVNKNEISLLLLTPSFLANVDPERFDRGLKVASVGDKCPTKLAEKWGKRFTFFNGYGPSETTIGASFIEYQKPFYSVNSYPIGKCFRNVKIYILNENLSLVAIGVPGEIYIGGIGIGRGYLNNEGLTAEKFLPDPFSERPGQRIYSTGDIAKYLPDGNIEFLGRKDGQVKIRGYRIELGEIDAIIHKHSSVRDSIVIDVKEEKGNEFIAAYIIKKDDNLTENEILSYIGTELPSYMVPRSVTFLKEFPLTPNKKIDRRNLPRPQIIESSSPHFAPVTGTEEIIANIWCDILKIDSADRNSNFFELGGHSLTATQLISRLRETFKKDINFDAVFESKDLKELAHAIDGENFDTAGDAKIKKADRNQRIPLSYSQKRLWFLNQLNPEDSSYNVPTVLRLKGHLNIDIVEEAINIIIEKYEILRTSFYVANGMPFQDIEEKYKLNIARTSAEGNSPEERIRFAKDLISRRSSIPFKLDELPLIRCETIEIEKNDHVLFFLLHHIITDGWSLSIIISDFIEIYSSLIDGKEIVNDELEIQYADYSVWQDQYIESENYEKELSYWKEYLRDIPPLLELTYDKSKPSVQTTNCDKVELTFEKSLVEKLNIISRSENSTLFMSLLAAFQFLLSKYSNTKDIIVGTPIAGRNNKQIEKLVGFFVNNLAIRTIVKEHETFVDLLNQVRDQTINAYANQSLPFDKLVEELQPVRDLSHQPIFQIMFVFQNLPDVSANIKDLEIAPFEHDPQAISYQIVITLSEGNNGVEGIIDFNSDLFERETIKRLAEHYTILIEEIVQNPELALSDIQLLTEYEKSKLLNDWNFGKEIVVNKNAVERFEETVEQFSECEALVYRTNNSLDPEIRMTYRELNSRVNKLAAYLREQNTKNEEIIGICMPRNIDIIISIFAILKTGSAFLPIDPTLPVQRIEFMLKTSDCTKILINVNTEATLEGLKYHKINLDKLKDKIDEQNDDNFNIEIDLNNLAYVIFTSGSTGIPKGVMLNHEGLSNLSLVQKEAFSISNDKKVMQFSSISFDASVWETVMALLNGGALYLTSKEVISSGYELSEYLENNNITTITLPPSVLAVLPENEYPHLDTLITAGEAISNETVLKWNGKRKYFNAYGPTETTVCATMLSPNLEYPKGPPIGRSIDNFETYILDSNLNPTGIGIPGELCIGGIGLARGYINQPDLTAERFIPNHFSSKKGARLYRTGDLVRYLSDGNIEFIGRVDSQIKHRGFRIEVSEIEHMLKKIDFVKDAAVTLKKIPNGQDKLVGYIVCPKSNFNKDSILDHLKEKLPDYMIPSSLLHLEEMPLTNSGKIDKNNLPLPDISREEIRTEYVGPRNDDEVRLIKIVEDLLGVERVGIKDNFFELGGHSLLATQFISRIKEEFNREIKLITLFEEPTIEGVSRTLDSAELSENVNKPKIQKISRESRRTKKADLL